MDPGGYRNSLANKCGFYELERVWHYLVSNNQRILYVEFGTQISKEVDVLVDIPKPFA